MTKIIDNLRIFNRKERFFLVGMALGNPDFTLCKEFREEIGKTFELEVPQDAFAAMDYHLDWIYASILLASNRNTEGIHSNSDGSIRATQQDIDLLVAYEVGKVCHIIMLEAKGVMTFSNRQLNSKIERLVDIFGEEGSRWGGVIPHFGIVSPKKPKGLTYSNWPNWLKPGDRLRWIGLSIPSELKKISRCNENGRGSIRGRYWKVGPG